MITKLVKVDGGYQLLVPTELVVKAGLLDGSEVELSAECGRLVARDSQKPLPKRYSLEELVAGITPENRHGEWDIGPPVGNEVW